MRDEMVLTGGTEEDENEKTVRRRRMREGQ